MASRPPNRIVTNDSPRTKKIANKNKSTDVKNQPTAKVAVVAVSSSLENDPAKEELLDSFLLIFTDTATRLNIEFTNEHRIAVKDGTRSGINRNGSIETREQLGQTKEMFAEMEETTFQEMITDLLSRSIANRGGNTAVYYNEGMILKIYGNKLEQDHVDTYERYMTDCED